MSPETRAKHRQDRKDAAAIAALGVVQYPMDLPSLYRAVYGDHRPKWLTTGYNWIDKPHRVANDAMEEVRALRAYILRGTVTPEPQGVTRQKLTTALRVSLS